MKDIYPKEIETKGELKKNKCIEEMVENVN